MTTLPLPERTATTIEPAPRAASKVEALKAGSDGLAGTLPLEILDQAAPRISDAAAGLLKFHGSYQQDDRDARRANRSAGGGRSWQFMVRTKSPGGRLTAEQYLLADELATTLANGTLRITTRQDFQFHGVGKTNLKRLIRALNERWVSTYGACGDIARNVVTCPVADLLPGSDFDYQALALQLSDRFTAESTAYYELWLDGEKFLSDGTRIKVAPKRDESFYGPTYMPRKHKMGIGLPHDNCIDIFTQDLALEAVPGSDGAPCGFNLIAGGGLGSTHGQAATFPRLGDRVGFVAPARALAAMEAATAIYRDHGDRSNRRHARLKYVLEERGVAWFREEMAARLGWTLGPVADVPPYQVDDHLGWRQQADGRWLVGVWVESGRIQDTAALPARRALAEVVALARPDVRLTAQQNIVLANISDADKAPVDALLRQHGLSTGNGTLSALRRATMACPALPTCGQALAEAERTTPALLSELERRGYGDERVSIRVSGCPNSCSRPPTAEVGIVGRSLGLYNVYLGGSFEGTRLARLYRADVREEEMAGVIAATFDLWRQHRRGDEAFGDWASRELVAGAPLR